jgi:glutaredoxin
MKMRYNKIYFSMIITITLFLFTGCINTDGSNIDANVISDVDQNSVILKDNPDKVTIYFFYGDGCPHCSDQKSFLNDLEGKYGDKIEIKMFETWKNSDNAKIFQRLAKAHGFQARGVPTTIIDEENWVGYADYMGSEMENKIIYCLENECINPADKLN